MLGDTAAVATIGVRDMTRAAGFYGDIHAGGRRLAWLKDPDGNILALAGR